jgi:hypothetical protein
MKVRDGAAIEKKEANAILSGGFAEKHGIKAGDVDQAALEQGMKHEREHTDDDDTARRIALDHLAEYPTYYEALGAMEAKLHRERLEAMNAAAAEADDDDVSDGAPD